MSKIRPTAAAMAGLQRELEAERARSKLFSDSMDAANSRRDALAIEAADLRMAVERAENDYKANLAIQCNADRLSEALFARNRVDLANARRDLEAMSRRVADLQAYKNRREDADAAGVANNRAATGFLDLAKGFGRPSLAPSPAEQPLAAATSLNGSASHGA